MSIQLRTAAVCTCKAYAFPHRAKGGSCHAKQSGPFCGECGEPAEATTDDFGIGTTEFWGHVSTHRDIQTVSRCCEADLFEDASLTIPYHNDEE